MAHRSDAERYAQYHRFLSALCKRERFSVQDIQGELTDMWPAFVTRLIRELAREGHLCETEKGAFEWVRSRDEFLVEAWLEARIFGPRLTRTPEPDRPRERLLARGAEDIRMAELLAILIRSGRPGESALQAGEKLAARFVDRLEGLPDAGRGELKILSPAVADTAYCQIMAGIELGRRVERTIQSSNARARRRLRSTADMLDFCQRKFRDLTEERTQERFRLVCLDTKRQVRGTHEISVGSLDESLVGPREVFRPAIRDAAAAVILVHNHPSGDPTPSPEDMAITRRLEQVAQTIGIKFLDHIVVAREGCLSIREYEEA